MQLVLNAGALEDGIRGVEKSGVCRTFVLALMGSRKCSVAAGGSGSWRWPLRPWEMVRALPRPQRCNQLEGVEPRHPGSVPVIK